MNNDILTELKRPFHPSAIEFKPGATTGDKTSALGLFYADLRAYQNRLDEICGMDWSVTFSPWGDRIVCHLTISGVTRSSTGEGDNQSEKSEIAGTAAEAQAFKRACAMFGLGRYLYDFPAVWAEFDGKKAFTSAGKTKLESVIVQHYRRATQTAPESTRAEPSATTGQAESTDQPAVPLEVLERLRTELDQLGLVCYGEQWTQVCRHNAERISYGKATTKEGLTVEQLGKLINGMKKLQRKTA